MDARDPVEAAEILDLLLKFFGAGECWTKGRFSDRRGKCCLVGALDAVSGDYATRGEAAERYMADVLSDRRDHGRRCHEDGVDYARLRAALRRAARGEWYQASEAVLRRDSLADFNDGCQDFAELRTLIEQARARAMNDAGGRGRRVRGPASGPVSWLWLRRDALADALAGGREFKHHARAEFWLPPRSGPSRARDLPDESPNAAKTF
jgi:hypothetical protein